MKQILTIIKKDIDFKSVDHLPTIPNDRLFRYYKYFCENSKKHYKDIHFLLWSEAMLEEVGYRRLTRSFENELNDLKRPLLKININQLVTH